MCGVCGVCMCVCVCVCVCVCADPQIRKLPVLRVPLSGFPLSTQFLGVAPRGKGLGELGSNSITLPAKIPELFGGRQGR